MSSILITGATGYFGQALVKRLLAGTKYDRICIYSRDEAKQALMRHAMNDDSRLRWFVGCVRDKERLARAMRHVDVVVHAAALKRIETCFYNPDEAVKTNIIGTMNVVNACAASAVEKAILLSTDKAYQPASIYGHTKAVSEAIFLAGNNVYGESGPDYMACRYGNVWNSTGSVVPRWKALIEQGANSVPVTDPDATRFYMSGEEAVALVLQTLAESPDTVAVPRYLPAYRIGDLAEAMGVDMDIIGMPKLEKLHESMCDGVSSDKARRMTIDELRLKLSAV